MQKLALLLLSMLFFQFATAQSGQIEPDFFGNLVYSRPDRSYEAKLERNIFNDLLFSDSRNNKETYESRYLDKYFPGIQQDRKKQTHLFQKLIYQHRLNQGYQISYSIDIFGKEIVKDNQGKATESGVDIFGNEYYTDLNNGGKASIKKNIFGFWEYEENGDKAWLDKDIFNKWSYEDSFGNKLEFAPKTWSRLQRKLGSDKDILWFFVDQFFY